MRLATLVIWDRGPSTGRVHCVVIVRLNRLHRKLESVPSAYSTSSDCLSAWWAASATMGFLLSDFSWPPGLSLLPFVAAVAASWTHRTVMDPC